MSVVRERWRVVPGWPLYRASNLGRIKRVAYGRWREHIVRSKGRVVTLRQNGQYRHFSRAAVVLLAFRGRAPEGKPYACHRDDNVENNVLPNLYWGSHDDNVDDALVNGRIGRGTFTAEHCAKISKALKGRKRPAWVAAKIRAGLKGRSRPAWVRKKLSIAMRGKTLSAAHRAAISRGSRRKKHSAETRAKIGAARKRAWAEVQ